MPEGVDMVTVDVATDSKRCAIVSVQNKTVSKCLHSCMHASASTYNSLVACDCQCIAGIDHSTIHKVAESPNLA